MENYKIILGVISGLIGLFTIYKVPTVFNGYIYVLLGIALILNIPLLAFIVTGAYFLAIFLSYVYYYLTKDKEGLAHFRSEILW